MSEICGHPCEDYFFYGCCPCTELSAYREAERFYEDYDPDEDDDLDDDPGWAAEQRAEADYRMGELMEAAP